MPLRDQQWTRVIYWCTSVREAVKKNAISETEKLRGLDNSRNQKDWKVT